MKILKIIGIILVSLAIIVTLVVILLPSHAHIERSIVIQAKPEQIYPSLIDFKKFQSWSPWARLDPNTQYEYKGPETGVGAQMLWSSTHDQVGTGTQTIIGVEENKRVKSEMEFGGFDKKSYADLILEPEGENTKVTWTYDGDMEGVYKIFGALMDNMLGPQYEEGLNNLKQVIESAPAAPAPPVATADSTQVQP